MDWKKLFGSITASVDAELRLRNAYLAAENRVLREQITGRVHLTDHERKALAEIGQQLGKALAEIATIAQPDTILAWRRLCVEQKGEGSRSIRRLGVLAWPRKSKVWWCGWPERTVRGAMIASWGLCQPGLYDQ